MSFKKILIAVDPSMIAAHAAEIGVELADRIGAQVALFHAINPPESFAADSGAAASELIALAKSEAKEFIDGLRQRLKLNASVAAFVEAGNPALEVVKAAKTWPADLVVIGSHGRGGVGRALLGSVAEAVMRRAPCPVLIVKGKE